MLPLKRFAALFASALFLLLPTTAAAAECEIVLGFKTLRDLIGHDIVGECLENERYAANGNSEQHTTGGLLVWRKADNWTAFTDGYRTWINGPNRLEQRLNTERFPWEVEHTIETLPRNPSEPHTISNLYSLERVSRPVLRALLARAGDEPLNTILVEHILYLAQLDEATALQLIQMPFMDSPYETGDPTVFVQAFLLARTNLSGLHQVLSDPRLEGGIADEDLPTFRLLILELNHPIAARAIWALPWLQDGIGRRTIEDGSTVYADLTYWEEELVLSLARLAKNSQDAMVALAEKPWLLDGLDEWEIQSLFRLAAISDYAPLGTLGLLQMPFLTSVSVDDYTTLTAIEDLLRSTPNGLQASLPIRY